MIVISIIIILAGLAIREYFHMSEQARIKRAKQDLKTLADAVRNYNQKEKQAFYKVRNLKSLVGRYLERLPRDPWGHHYVVDGTFLSCFGPDGKKSGDDIKERYERESIVRNPTFQTSYSLEKQAAFPTGWTFNPQGLSNAERSERNVVDLTDEQPTVSSGRALKVQ